MEKKSLGIYGFGRFGTLVAEHTSSDFDVYVSNRSDKRADAERLGVKWAEADECAAKDIVVFCVPISEFEKALRSAAPNFKDGALILDTCSIKEEPARALEKYVPKRCECIATHPQFGPDTAKNGLAGLRITVCPVRVSDVRLSKVKEYLSSLNLQVVQETPEMHDRKAANTQALSHFLGRGLFGCGILSLPENDANAKILQQVARIAINDSNELFVDLQTRNRFAADARARFINKLKDIQDRIPNRAATGTPRECTSGVHRITNGEKMHALCQAVAFALNASKVQDEKATTKTAEYLQQVARSAREYAKPELMPRSSLAAVTELVDKLVLVDRELNRPRETMKSKRCRNGV